MIFNKTIISRLIRLLKIEIQYITTSIENIHGRLLIKLLLVIDL